MPRRRVNDVDLYYEVTGHGDPLMLVHGSWDDHTTWQAVVPALAASFQVVTYDRRGHSQSERPAAHGSRREDEEDLAALMAALDCAPAHVAGNSFGGSIVLGLASRRPELFRSAIAHEPPLIALVADDRELQPLLQEVQATATSVLEQLAGGDIPGGTRRFVEELALGPGMWAQLPEEARQIAMANAPTFVDEQRDPAWASLDLADLVRFARPVLLSRGDQSPPWFSTIVAKLAQALPWAEVQTIPGAGHIPHETHPPDYVATLTSFLRPSG
jgi:pimeloyl-ACP methyl ester carboxylesterase